MERLMTTNSPDTLAIAITRIEGKLDLSAQQNTHMQGSLEEMKQSMREDRLGMEVRLKDHTEAVNPHPAQEAWLRQVYSGHDARLKALENESAADTGHDSAVRWLIGIALTEGLALAGLIVQVFHP
jgi:hypothetical protein